MKVAFQIDQLWFPVPGGIGTYVRELGEALIDSDDLVLQPFHCAIDGDPDEPDGPSRLTGLRSVRVEGSIRTVYPRWTLLGRPALPPGLDDVDVVHATNPASVPPVRDHQRLVVTVHDLAVIHHPELFPMTWRRLYRAGLRATARRAHAVVVPSRHTADDLISTAGVPSDRVHVTPLAPAKGPGEGSEAAHTTMGIPSPYLLSVGTQEPRKNLVRLVRAYRQVAPDVPHALVLAGPPGWHEEALRAELDRPGPGVVIRTGRVASGDLDALYRGADAFAYVSTYEGFGLPVAEAMARGVPVVASSTTSLPELVGDAGLLVDPTDVAAIAEALAAILTDAGLVDDLRTRAKARGATFTWEATARATLEAYRAAIGAT